MNVRVVGALTVSILGAGLASSQTPVFRAATQYVAMDVIVRDGDDRPVTDLTKDDFVVTDAGRPQQISDFAYISIPVADRAIDLDAAPPPSSDVATNGRMAQDSRALVLVIDNIELHPQDLVPIKRVLAEFLRKLSPDDQVALTYIGRSDLSHDFTNDVDELIGSIKLKDALGQMSDGSQAGAIRSLDFVVRTLAESHQSRRAVVLLTSRTCNPAPPAPPPVSGRNDFNGGPARHYAQAAMESDECRDLIQQARRSDVVFYTLDPRLFKDANSVNGIRSIETPGDAAVAARAALDADNSMKTLAAATGGRAFTGSNPLRSVQDIMVDNGSYYLLGFYPNPVVNDGKFHDVTVTLTRPGLHVRARPGYMAGGDKPARPSTPTRDMTAKLGAGIDDPSLPIRAIVAPVAEAPDGTRAIVTVEISYPRTADAAQTLNDELRMGVLSLTPDAKIKRSFQRPSTFSGSWQPGARGVFLMNDVIDLPHQTLSLRIGVTSRALEKTGTAHITVDVPDFRRKDLQVSPLVLGSSDTASDAVSGFDYISPFVPFQPTTSRSFARTDSVRVFANVFWKFDDEAVIAEVSVKGASPFSPRQLTLPGRPGKDGHRAATLDTTLSLKDLAPGAYVLEVDVHSPKHKPAVREVPVEVR